MRRFRILTLMVLILALAVAIAALRNADDVWAGSLMTVTPLILCVSLVGALCGRPARREGRLGFAIFGGAYFALAFLGLSESKLALLPTSRLLKLAHERVVPATFQVIYTVMQPTPPSPATTVTRVVSRPVTATRTLAAKVSVNGSERWTRSRQVSPDLTEASSRWRALLPGAANLEAFNVVGHCLFALIAGLLGSAVAIRFRPRDDEAAPVA
jgi:hypothetical protein